MRQIITIVLLSFLVSCVGNHTKLINNLAGTYKGVLSCDSTLTNKQFLFDEDAIIVVTKDTFYGDMLFLEDYIININEDNLTFDVDGGCSNIGGIKGKFSISDKIHLEYEEFDHNGSTRITCNFSGFKQGE